MILLYARKNNGRRIIVLSGDNPSWHEWDVAFGSNEQSFAQRQIRLATYHEWWRAMANGQQPSRGACLYPIVREPHADSYGLDVPLELGPFFMSAGTGDHILTT